MAGAQDIKVPEPLARMRRYELDDALLLFDRETGLTAMCDGPETLGLRRRAPRVVQFALSNACNLTCSFCYREPKAGTGWTEDDAFQLLSDLGGLGVMEVAFGGGEPFLVPYFPTLVERLHRNTKLAVSVTTNGTRLNNALLRRLTPALGQLRLSIYDEPDWCPVAESLASSGVRWGVNYLLTPNRIAELAGAVLEMASRGCRDILLLSYNGPNSDLHLRRDDVRSVADTVGVLSKALVGRVVLKLSVCWGSRLAAVPQLFTRSDCAAGEDFVVVTADRRVQPCSFHQLAVPFADARDLVRVWRDMRTEFRRPACIGGCARLPGFGLEEV